MIGMRRVGPDGEQEIHEFDGFHGGLQELREALRAEARRLAPPAMGESGVAFRHHLLARDSGDRARLPLAERLRLEIRDLDRAIEEEVLHRTALLRWSTRLSLVGLAAGSSALLLLFLTGLGALVAGSIALGARHLAGVLDRLDRPAADRLAGHRARRASLNREREQVLRLARMSEKVDVHDRTALLTVLRKTRNEAIRARGMELAVRYPTLWNRPAAFYPHFRGWLAGDLAAAA